MATTMVRQAKSWAGSAPALRVLSTSPALPPGDIARVALVVAAIAVVDLNHSNSVVRIRIGGQRLSSVAIHSAEVEVRRVLWKRLIAVEPAPLGGIAGLGDQAALVTSDLHLGASRHRN